MLSRVCKRLLPCRVNLIGGSQVNGTATDTAAVFTPAKAADKQLYMYNLTLPHGFFSRSPLGATDLFQSKLLLTQRIILPYAVDVQHSTAQCHTGVKHSSSLFRSRTQILPLCYLTHDFKHGSSLLLCRVFCSTSPCRK